MIVTCLGVLFSVNISVAQNGAISDSLKFDKFARNYTPIVSADRLNVFYIGIDNSITAALIGIPDSLVKVQISKGKLKKVKDKPYKYIVNVQSPGLTTVDFSIKETDDSISHSVDFRVEYLPNPVVKIGKRVRGEISHSEMRAHKRLYATLEDFPVEASFHILSFQMVYAKPREDIRVITNQGATFGLDALRMIREASVGDIYYFDNIRVKGPDGITRRLPEISFKIR